MTGSYVDLLLVIGLLSSNIVGGLNMIIESSLETRVEFYRICRFIDIGATVLHTVVVVVTSTCVVRRVYCFVHITHLSFSRGMSSSLVMLLLDQLNKYIYNCRSDLLTYTPG